MDLAIHISSNVDIIWTLIGGPIAMWQEIRKFIKLTEIRYTILVHNWTLKKYVPLDRLNMCR